MSLTSDEGFVPFRGYRTWYKIIGPGGAAGRPPLLCLHGGPGLPHDYLEPLENLARSGRQIIFYDQLGSGNSDCHTDKSLCTVESFLEELNAVRRWLNLREVHILGHSWGGMLALEYMLTGPSGVVSLIGASTLASMPLLVAEIARLHRTLLVEYRDSVDQRAVSAFIREHGC